jgi:hypothetical protein
MRRQLESDLEIARERWQITQKIIADWRAAAARFKKRNRAKRTRRENPYF